MSESLGVLSVIVYLMFLSKKPTYHWPGIAPKTSRDI